MKNPHLLVAFLLVAPVIAFAQGNSPNTPASAKPPTADDAWARIAALAPPLAPPVGNASVSTPAQAKSAQEQRAQASRRTAQAAKDFYTAYPTDARAAQARKLEATASLQGVTDNDPAYDQSATAIAQAYRTDARHPISDRIEVAIGVERLLLARRTGKPIQSKQAREMEKIATGLRREFSDHPRVFDFYANVARSADQATANRIALLLVDAPASPETRAEARTILQRTRLIGQPFTMALPSLQGSRVDLAGHNDRPTVVFLYSASVNSGSLGALKRFLKTPVADCRWVYVAVNSTTAQVEGAKARAPFPGTHCALASFDSATLLGRLRNRHFPFVYVVNRRGLLTGCGPVEELPGLVWDANR